MNYNKKNIILDLDETLINAQIIEDFDLELYKSLYKSKLTNNKSPFRFEIMEDYYIIFQRPHLQEFLDYIFNNFNVSVWTAASKDYALFIIKNFILIKPNRKLDYMFYSYHCSFSKKLGKGSKDLSLLRNKYKLKNYNKYNTIIIDDYSEVFKTQPKNCIPAIEFSIFSYDMSEDTFLKDIIPILEEYKNSDYIPEKSIKNFIEKNKKITSSKKLNEDNISEISIDSVKSNLTDIME